MTPSQSSSPDQRVRLRPMSLSDAGWIARESARPEVHRMAGRIPARQPALSAEGFVLIMQARERVCGDCVRVIERIEDGEPLGLIGLHRAGEGAHELGYWLARDAWGQGYATEAGRAMLAAFEARGGGALAAGHYVDNPASGRVLEKLGFSPTGETPEQFSLGRMAKAPCRRMVRPGPGAV